MSTVYTQRSQMISITPNFFTVYNERQHSTRTNNTEVMRTLPVETKHNGSLSYKAQKRIQKALDWLVFIARDKMVVNPSTNTTFKFKLSMLTLTLPCDQMHSDKYIKNKMLNSFLTTLRTKFYLTNYVWKAEKTERGNIHFHIIIDRYIDYREINRLWNKTLDLHGYIQKYQANMYAHHNGGFQPFKDLLKYWPLKAQKKAYLKGIKNSFTQPSGTSDVHSLRNLKNASAYVKKYMQKNPDQTKLFTKMKNDYCKKNNTNSIPDHIVESIRTYVNKKLSVDGNIWFVSRSLSNLKNAVDFLHNGIVEDLQKVHKLFKDKIIYCDFATVFLIDIETLNQSGCVAICKVFLQHVLRIRALFYPKRDFNSSLI